VAKAQLGTKRIDPETGRKFYDLNKDPIVSPYTGKSYPRSYFDSGSELATEEDEPEEKELGTEEEAPETVSLEEADEEQSGGEDLPDLGDDDDVDLGDEESDDTFLEEEEEEEDDVSGIVGVGDEDDEV
jgi:uncharacterized protein (TIGR02300 family)